MQITRPGILVLLLLATSACASTPGDKGSREAAKKPLVGGVAEFQVNSFDGRVLKARVLLGATVEPLVVDGRLNEWFNVDLDNIRACDKKDRLVYIPLERFLPPHQAEDVITIRPKCWYGGDVFFLLFDKEETDLEPDCFEAELVMRDIGMREAARKSIRVVRTDKPPIPPDGGTEAPKPPASDAGAP